MLGFALDLGAAAPRAAAKEKTIELDRVPKKIRGEIAQRTKGGSHLTHSGANWTPAWKPMRPIPRPARPGRTSATAAGGSGSDSPDHPS
jgi:hypothetical protein